MDNLRSEYFVSELCEALGVSRSGYYAYRGRAVSKRYRKNNDLLQIIKTIHAHRYTRGYGSPRMTRSLRAAGHCCSENRVARLMRQEGLCAKARRPFRPRTTQPDHAAHPSPNLLKKVGPASGPGAHLVSDITYIPTREGWLYLAIVMDLYSRTILGWRLADSMDASLVTGALEKALRTGLVPAGAIFHSDRGCQYSCSATRTLLGHAQLRQSMSAQGDCYDNAFAESVFASIKSELFDDLYSFPTKAAASLAVFDYLETFYNRARLHSSLDYVPPLTFLENYFKNLKPLLS